jgi:hypothetical protein
LAMRRRGRDTVPARSCFDAHPIRDDHARGAGPRVAAEASRTPLGSADAQSRSCSRQR